MVNEIFKKAVSHARAVVGDLAVIIKKDLSSLGSKVEETGKSQTKAIKTSGDAILGGLKGVEEAVKAQEVAESVTIKNPEAINKAWETGVIQIVSALREEINKLDKEIVVKNDLGQLASAFKGSQEKKDLIKELNKIEKAIKDIERPEITDYTLILSDIADAVDKREELRPLLEELVKKETNLKLPDVLPVDLDPNLIERDRIKTVLPDEQVAKMASVISQGGNKHVILSNQDGENISVQHPLPCDGDSVYAKDIWVEESDMGDFSGLVTDLFDNLHTVVSDTTSNNPKEILIHFNRTIPTLVIGLGAFTGNFSNTKIIGLTSGNVEFTLYDNSGDNTKETTATIYTPTVGFNAVKIQFHTTDTVSLSNIFVLKAITGAMRIQGQKPDGTFTEFQSTTSGNFKVAFEEYDDTFLDNPLPVTKGFNIPIYDYVARGWVAGTFTETWTFKTGGSGGSTVATITIVYDDVDQSNIISVTHT